MNAAELANAQVQVERQRLPLFFGSEKDVFTAKQWAERIQRARTSVDPEWTDAITMSAVFNSLRGEALAWFDGYRNEFRDNTDMWANFRQEFIKAFGKTNTAYTSAHALHGL